MWPSRTIYWNTPDPSPALSAYLERTRNAFARAQTPQDVAGQVVDLLAAEQPAFRVLSSDTACGLAGTKVKDLDGGCGAESDQAWFSYCRDCPVWGARYPLRARLWSRAMAEVRLASCGMSRRCLGICRR